MRTSLLVALGVALMTCPSFAQKMGSSNQNAPSVTQNITFAGKQSIDLTYVAITWAEGNWAKAIEAKDDGMRKAINGQAEKSPLGTFKLSSDMVVGGKKVAAGTYKLAFVLSDSFGWELILQGDKEKLSWPLKLQDNDKQVKRLALGLRPGEKDMTASIHIAFGNKRGEVEIGTEQKS